MSTGTAISLEQYLSHIGEPDADYIDGEIDERNVGERTHAKLQARITAYLLWHYEQSGIEVFTEIRIRVSPTRYRIPDVCATVGDPGEEVLTKPPFLCIEIVSPEDRIARIEVRIQDYLAMGVPYVWLLDPYTRKAYIATRTDGLREVMDGALRTAEPGLEVPVEKLWS